MLAFLHVPLRAQAEEHHGCSQGCGGGKGLNGSACSGEQLAAGWSLDWESSPALTWSQGEPWWHDNGGLSGLLWGPTVLLCPIWPRGDGRRGCPIASPHLGVGNSSTEGALFLQNEWCFGPGLEEGLLRGSR